MNLNVSPDNVRGQGLARVVRKGIFPVAWVLGGVGLAVAVLLFVAVLVIHAGQRTTGYSWQPAALLALIAGAFAVPILIAALLVRFGSGNSAQPGDDRR
ncbi:hypothetical protein VMT65_09510 [Nocardia sp. CDC153]|uniref:hypothetical protein n=1 Tax=Nocardia sp. CDC153 TaxID=3112167 RepID=UPI002DBA3707|nr:hypothetical protein [Nocardia sp. CDC153]MEC3953264.1 hypothetical protein [Nocardia sp. CDC153]